MTSKKVIYAIYGASGFGREILPFARSYIATKKELNVDLIFLDDACAESTCNGYRVLSFDQFIHIEAKEKFVSVAIADCNIRKKLIDKCEANGIKNWSLAAQNIIVLDEVKIGEGSILCPFVTLTSNIVIGDFFQANLYSYVAHDCVIGDYVTFAPSVKCNGNVIIEDFAYLGTGAIIKQGKPERPLRIGRGAVIAAGAVVTKSVPDGVTVLGNPARPLSKDSLRSK